MSFTDAIKTCITEKYVDFTGRASREEFWWFYLAQIIIIYLAGLVGNTFSSLVSLALFLPSISVGVRRMHDVGKKGWFIIIPFYNIYLAILKSEPQDNEWGPAPVDVDK